MAYPKCKYAVLKYYSRSFQCEKYVKQWKIQINRCAYVMEQLCSLHPFENKYCRLSSISSQHMFICSYRSAWQQHKPHQACWPPNPQAQRCPLPSAARCSCIHAGRGSSAAALTALETAGCHDYQIDPMSHQAPGDWKLREKILIESNTNKFWQTRRYCC